METQSSTPRSRRALLTAGAAGVAAVISQALGRAAPVRAGAGSDGDPVVVGGEYYDARTKIYIGNSATSDYVLAAQSTHGGIALSGVSDSNYGVTATSTSNHGVHGKSTSSHGVYGESETGFGVTGYSSSGFGLYGIGGGPGVGLALFTDGRVAFSTAGLATIKVGAKSKTIAAISLVLTAGSQVHCTLETNQAGLSVERVTKNISGNSLKIYLTGVVASGKYAKVAWAVFG